MTSRYRPGVAFWATVVVVVLGLYLASTGPAVWLYQHKIIPPWAESAMDWFYWPFDWFMRHAPQLLRAPLWWYLELWGWKL